MKKLSLIALVTFCLFTIISSCKKDKTEDPAPTSSSSTIQNSVSKHWVVGNKSGRISNASGYLWFEFNSNNKFIIAKSDGTYISGDYSISADGKTITLVNYGVITINS